MDKIDLYFEAIKQMVSEKDIKEVIDTGIQARQNIVQLSGGNNDAITAAILYSAIVGCCHDGGKMSKEEKEMVDVVAGPIVAALGQQAYDAIESVADEADYDVLSAFAQAGQEFGMSVLILILMFMYVDGKGSDKVLAKLKEIFQLNLLTALSQEVK